MHRKASTFVLSLCLAVQVVAAASAPAPAPKSPPAPVSAQKRAESWKKDVRFLATELPRVYPEVFSAQKRKAWDQESERIASAASTLSDAEVKVALLRLLASLKDPATRLQWSGEHFYTITVQNFPDGPRVIRAQQGLDRAVGARLVKVGDASVEEVAKRLAPLSGCEDEACRKDAVARQLTSAEILRTLRLVPAEGSATFGFEDDDGRFSLEIPPREPRETNIGMWATAIDSSPEKVPLYLRHRQENYWFELLPDSKTLYIQYARSVPVAGKSMSSFVDQLFRAVEGKEIDRVVVDLRRNTATDGAFLRPLLDGLEARPALRRPGKLFVIVGPMTYPAGADNARELVRRFRATLVGETVPARGRTTGESKSFALPESKLRVVYPALSPGASESKPLVPDIVSEATFENLRDGLDAALEAILARAGKGPGTAN